MRSGIHFDFPTALAETPAFAAALGNVLQNAFKFTQPGSEVTLSAYANAGRVLINVEDRCGGLPSGDTEQMFLPFRQSGKDKSGLGSDCPSRGAWWKRTVEF